MDLGELPAQGEALEFSIEIGVLPKAELGEYMGVEVAAPRAGGRPDEQIERRSRRCASASRGCETAERPAAAGDFVVIDYVGSPRRRGRRRRAGAASRSPGGEGRDQLVELGSGSLIPGFEEALLGARRGRDREVALTFPADYGNERAGRARGELRGHRQGGQAQGAAARSTTTSRSTPASTTSSELREDIRKRLLEADEAAVEAEFRQAALDAAVAGAAGRR